MSIEMTAGVLVANMLEGMQFALGPTMAVRSACVEEMGGFRALGQYCADDFLLGNLIAAKGHRVVFSHHAIDHIVLNTGFVDSMRHQVRWSKSTRFSRPKGHFGTSLTFSMPFALLAFCHGALAALALGGSHRARMGHRESHGPGCCRRSGCGPGALAVANILLFPLRDLMGFGFWVASYGSNKILWRGEQYMLETGGHMRPVHLPASIADGECHRSQISAYDLVP